MKTFILTLAMVPLFSSSIFAKPLAVGADAPDLTVLNQDGQEVRLAEAYAKGLVLIYFYPKAGTPGCTAQACSLRDASADFAREGLTVLGVSGDSPEGQKKFREKYQLPFTLLADTDSKVAEAFGVPTLAGFPKRQSFLIKDGKIVWVSLSAETSKHAAEVQQALDQLGGGKSS